LTRGILFAAFMVINYVKRDHPELQKNNKIGWWLDLYFLAAALMPLIFILGRIVCFPVFYLLFIDDAPEKVHDKEDPLDYLYISH